MIVGKALLETLQTFGVSVCVCEGKVEGVAYYIFLFLGLRSPAAGTHQRTPALASTQAHRLTGTSAFLRDTPAAPMVPHGRLQNFVIIKSTATFCRNVVSCMSLSLSSKYLTICWCKCVWCKVMCEHAMSIKKNKNILELFVGACELVWMNQKHSKSFYRRRWALELEQCIHLRQSKIVLFIEIAYTWKYPNIINIAPSLPRLASEITIDHAIIWPLVQIESMCKSATVVYLSGLKDVQRQIMAAFQSPISDLNKRYLKLDRLQLIIIKLYDLTHIHIGNCV